MPADNKTNKRQYPLPDANNSLQTDVQRIVSALNMVDKDTNKAKNDILFLEDSVNSGSTSGGTRGIWWPDPPSS